MQKEAILYAIKGSAQQSWTHAPADLSYFTGVISCGDLHITGQIAYGSNTASGIPEAYPSMQLRILAFIPSGYQLAYTIDRGKQGIPGQSNSLLCSDNVTTWSAWLFVLHLLVLSQGNRYAHRVRGVFPRVSETFDFQKSYRLRRRRSVDY
jgi:hypothetical protein